MQSVDVLGDHRGGLAAANELGHGAMPAVRLRRADHAVAGEFAPPRLAPRLLGGEEVFEVDRRQAGPDPARAAESRDARLGAEGAAGEDGDALRLRDHAAKGGGVLIEVHGRVQAGYHPSRRSVQDLPDMKSHAETAQPITALPADEEAAVALLAAAARRLARKDRRLRKGGRAVRACGPRRQARGFSP